jgi:multiple sugar transport system ATP-binding protein
VIVETASGARLRAKVSVQQRATRGDAVGLAFDAAEISLFDTASGRALQTARYDTPLAGGARHG